MVTFLYEEKPLFFDRSDAGRRLAEKLSRYEGGQVVVFGIPHGGVPVATEVAEKLGAPLDIIVPRKIPIPNNPEAGFGAVTEDGIIVLNESLVKQLGLNKYQIQFQAEKVRAEVARRTALYRGRLKAPPVREKTAIIIDDGLASGYTMVAAVKSIQSRGATKIVTASPVASGSAYDLLKPLVDELVCLVVARTSRFAVASFYYRWHDLSETEVMKYLRDWKLRRQPLLPS